MARFLPFRLGCDQRGSVTVLASYFFIVLMSASAVTIQGSDMYVTNMQGQRTADIANLAAASTSSSIVSGAPSAMATATALNLATINGFGNSTVATTVTNSGTTLNTTITTSANIFLSEVYNAVASTTVFNHSTVKPVTPLTQGCVASLGSTVSVFTSGSIAGSSCDVIAATNLSNNAAKVNVAGVAVGVSSSSEAGNLTSPTTQSPAAANFMYNATLTDPIATNSALTTIKSHLTAMATWPYVTASPVQLSTATATASANPRSFSSGTNTVANGHYSTLAVSGTANVTFSGSGSADTSCTNPTTFSGATTVSVTSNTTFTFNSGCYVFGGDFTNNSTVSILGVLATGATVTLVFKGQIVNTYWGTIQLPAATYSIAGTVSNPQGGTITLGNGSKVFGGTINNGHSVMNLGNGPFYILGSSVTQAIGTLIFGNGPFYVWNCTISNTSSGTMEFGTGPFYFYNSTLNAGVSDGGYPYTSLAGGPYYFYLGSLTTGSNSTTKIGTGNVDMYGGNIALVGAYQQFGWGGTASTGTSMISLNGGEFSHAEGTFVAQGVTIAETGNIIAIFGPSIDLEAPTAASPTYGAQNIAIYSATGDVHLAGGSVSDIIGGVVYAPTAAVDIYTTQTMNPPSGGCLEAVGSSINIFQSATINAVPCTGMTISAIGGVPLLQ